MIPQVLSRYPMPGLASIGMCLFLGVFIATLIWIFRKDSHRVYETASRLPFQPDAAEKEPS